MKKLSLTILCLFLVLFAVGNLQAERTVGYTASHLKKAPAIDAALSDWPAIETIDLYEKKLNDLRAWYRIGWDEKNLYLGIKIADKAQVNANKPAKIQDGDAVVLQLCTNPEKQQSKPGEFDFDLVISPTSDSGKPAFRLSNKSLGINIINPAKDDASGIKWAVSGDKTWTVEAAIPFKLLKHSPKAGEKLSFILIVFDRDKKDVDEWKNAFHTRVQTFNKKKPINERPYLVLGKSLVKATKKAPPARKNNSGGITISHHAPCNMFWLGEEVKFDGTLKIPESGKGKVAVKVLDYDKKAVFEKGKDGEFTKNQKLPLPLNFGKLPTGYYEVWVSWNINGTEGNKMACSFGVAPKITRSAKEFRDKNFRMGLKMWYLGKAWWRGNAQWNEKEAVDATCKLGLQWTRALMQQTSQLATTDLIKDYPMNVILKVESFPKEAFDTERYGPMDEWVKKNDRAWMKKTVPKEAIYKKWLKTKLAEIPKEQNVFEIWNEAWDKMTAEDLAKISNWVTEVILAERPDAIIGPNLMGRTSKYGYDAAYIKAGGMKGMKMVALHPYAGSENRNWMRQYKKWLKDQTGRDISIYVTEYGSHSCPEGPSKRSEQEQSQRVVRQTLALYAEDVKAMTPHWMGQREQNKTYHEDWFGYYRLNHQPKPVLMALANVARMIDGKNYVGDLWFGPGVGAMVFEKDGVNTLALWTKKGTKDIVIEPGVEEVTVVDIVGNEKKVNVTNGKLPIKVGLDTQYIVGISPQVAKLANKELNPKRWPQAEKGKKNSRIVKQVKNSPKIDGDFSNWKNMSQLELVNPKVNGKDASGIAYLGWDDKYLYLGVDMRDNQVMNTKTAGLLYQEDSIELFISTEPRDTDPGFGPKDHQYFIAPTSQNGKVIVGEIVNRESHKLEAVPGLKEKVQKTNKGWSAQLAIPWNKLNNFKPETGKKLALDLRVNDADNSHKRWKIDPTDVGTIKPGNPERWSINKLK